MTDPPDPHFVLKAFNESIVQGVAEAFLIEDTESILIFANPAAEKLLGYSQAELIGRPWSILVPEDQLERVRQETASRPAGAATQYETALLGKSGRVIPVIVNATPLFDGSHFAGVVSGFTDITERKQAEDALARRARELSALHETVLEVNSQQNLDTLLHTIVERAVRLLDVRGGELHLCDPEHRETRCVVSYNTPIDYTGMIMRYGEGAGGLVAEIGQPLIITDYHTWQNRVIACDDDALLTTVLGVPMIWRGEVIGALLALDKTEVRTFTPADQELLAMFASQAAVAVANARLLEAERTAREQAEALHDTAAALTSALSLAEVLDRVLVEVGRVTPYDTAFISLVEDGVARAVRSRGFTERGLAEALATLHMTIAEVTTLRLMAETGEPVIVTDTHTYPGWVIFPVTQWVRSHLGVPLHIKGQLLGFLNLYSATPGFFGQARTANVKTFANQVAIAVANAQLYEAERQQRAHAEALRDTAAALASALSFDDVLGHILEQADRVVPHDAATIMLIEDGDARVVRSRGFTERGLPDPASRVRFLIADTSNLNHIVTAHRPVVIPDTREYTGWANLPETLWIASHIGMPISSQGRLIGILNLDSATPGFFTAVHVKLLQAFADQAAVAIERAQLFEATRRRAAEMEALADLSTGLRTASTASEMLPTIITHSMAVSQAIIGIIFRVEPQTGDLVIWAWQPPHLPLAGLRYTPGAGVAGHVVKTGEIYTTEDVQGDILVNATPEESGYLAQVRGGISLPLRTSGGHTVGVLQLGLQERHRFSTDEVHLLVSIAEVAANALNRAQLLETLEERVAARTAELSQREAELQAANARLADLELLKSQFLANASHELRTPLTNIIAYLDLLERGRPEKRDRYMTVLKRESAMLHLLVENLLDVAQLDFGRAQLRLAEMDLNLLLTAMQETCALLVADRALRLQFTQAPDLPPTLADMRMLRQVITNLVSYAAEQSSSGAMLTLQTERQSDATGAWATLTVRGDWLDRAPAIHTHSATEADRSRTIMPGAGLRLAICQKIVGRLGGKLITETSGASAAGLSIWLPAARAGGWTSNQ